MQIQPSLLVACLCADWCGTCTDYAVHFAQLKNDFPAVEFRWIDIENEAELVDDVDVENFPTILIARNAQTLFFGTVLPHIESLRRLIQAQAETASPADLLPEVQALTERLSQPEV